MGGDITLGVETGVVEVDGGYYEESVCVAQDRVGRQVVGVSERVQLPDDIARRMRRGDSHEAVMRELCPESRDTLKYYTNGRLTREQALEECVRRAVEQLL